MLLALYVGAVLSISFLVYKQTSNQRGGNARKKENPFEKSATEKLPVASPAQLAPSYQTPVSSVTENTTRTLDEVFVERK